MVLTDEQVERKLVGLEASRDAAAASLLSERSSLAAAERLLDHSRAARKIVQEAAVVTQTMAHQRVASVVARCLTAVFASPYEFRLSFEEKRGKTEASFVFARDGIELGDALDMAGGGVVDVAAFALRVACLMIAQPPGRRLIVLDEPFKHLSFEHVPSARELLEMLAREFQVQVLMVTHNRQLACGKVIELS